MKKIIVIILLAFTYTSGQIDTIKWYPLEIGNKWQYCYGWPDVYCNTVEIIGDTLMPNGITYFIVQTGLFSDYQRTDKNEYVYGYNNQDSTEFGLYDFVSKDKSFWEHPYEKLDWGIISTCSVYNSFLNKTTRQKKFDWVLVDSSSIPADTIFGAIVDVWPLEITQGVGITSFGSDPLDITAGGLSGAIINGDTLGIVTSVSINEYSEKNYCLLQNYPNPFNPSTVIEYIIPENGFVELIIYNSLGERVEIMLKSYQTKGKHRTIFDGSKFTSGVYYYVLRTDNNVNAKKMLLMK